ncbi:MAG: HAMP domain-containing sensor histidine kinase [Actinobacteria bacterium]|nr:HAMP domain-containing sensor histidine kinase [Actinomycetota bacterium]
MKYGLSKWSLRNQLILATLALATIAITASDLAATNSLRSFLISQADNQLNEVVQTSLLRLDRAGIEPEAESEDKNSFRPLRPLSGVPTTTAVTLLDLSGNVVGQVGGQFANSIDIKEFHKLTPAEVLKNKGKPFTIPGADGQPDIRAVARILPSGVGTVVISVALDSVDRTMRGLAGIYFLISLIVIIAIGFVARSLIKLSLKPLNKIEETAAAIADGDLSARLPEVNPNTEVGRLTGSLNTMLSRIEESFAVRTESENKLRRFIADASHELRTPLTAIRGFAELHRQGAVTGEDKTKELISRIEKESIRMSSLVEDLLLLARLDQSRELTIDPVDINHLVNEAIASAKAAGPSHEITLKSSSDEVFVLGDSMRIHQAVSNLLANARTHTPAGTKIEIEILQNESEVQISVSDNGPGLSPEDQTRIFERFFRADPSRARVSGEGSGLGLAIVDAVMKAHGGSVEVLSELNQGAKFTLHFPVKGD